MSSPRARSRTGCPAMSASRLVTARSAAPSCRHRTATSSGRSQSANSAYAGPHHSASASSSSATAPSATHCGCLGPQRFEPVTSSDMAAARSRTRPAPNFAAYSPEDGQRERKCRSARLQRTVTTGLFPSTERVRARPKPRRQSRYVIRLPATLAELCRIVHR
jgi:hypothetical protein